MEPTADLASLLLPEGARLLHIGPPKTGTTTIQGAFHAARPAVLAQGVRYAGRTRHARRAVFAVTGRSWVGGPPPPIGEWEDLVHEIRQAPEARVVLSSEAFASADATQIRRVVEELDPARVHVVLTLRPLARILPSQWQQSVQSGLEARYADWLDALFAHADDETAADDDGRERAGRGFWYRHRHDHLVARWAKVVGPERITVVVLDDRDRARVLRVFEALTGLRDGTLEEQRELTNRSMTQPEAEVVRAFNAAFWRAGLGLRLHDRLLLRGAGLRMKQREPSPDWARIETPQWALERAGAIATDAIANIAASGVRVVGDLAALTVLPAGSAATAEPAGSRVPAEVAAELALGILFAGGLADEGGDATTKRQATKAVAAGGTFDTTGIPSSVLARDLARRARAAATRRIRRRARPRRERS
jgi:hypothetical protein